VKTAVTNQNYTEEEITAYQIWGILATNEFRMLIETQVRKQCLGECLDLRGKK
jgi:hypothetical protein